MTDEQLRNKELIEKYPFLMPTNRWTGEVPDDYDYTYTEIDAMPEGWMAAFGMQLCDDLKAALIADEAERTETPEERRKVAGWHRTKMKDGDPDDYLHTWKFVQLKEKYGSLRIYCNFYTPRVDDVIHKYDLLSETICIGCGKPATKVSQGWISPWCDDCAAKLKYERFLPIDYDSDEVEEECCEE